MPAPSFAAEDGGALLIQWDNDKVVDTDRHYTNGVRFAYTPNTIGEPIQSFGATVAGLSGFTDQSALRTGFAFGQDMYTPEDVYTFTPDPLDRPYAGWAYLGLTMQNDTTDVQDTMELDLGVIGPAARAGNTQNAFHRIINSPVSHGWRSQIHNEIGLLATRTYKRRSSAVAVFGSDWLKTDIVGHGTAQLGNVHTGAGIGATVRMGENLHEDFGPIYGTFAIPHQHPAELAYSFFAGAEARTVIWDVFLDGNTLQDSANVKKNPYVMETRLGFTVHSPLPKDGWIKGMSTSINMVHRTREFKTQDKSDRYGSLQVTLNF